MTPHFQAPPCVARGDRKVDIWLRRSLAEAHDEVLGERLPAAWLAQIDKSLPRT